jgi:succinate dehydrogenase/fumarate reductase flavoprotein subunit
LETKEHTITTDVLVIGSGFAGCFAAIRARELGAEVLMVEQGKSGFAGFSAIGTHMTRVVLPEDDFDLALKSTVLQCDFMVDQEYAEGVIAESYDRLKQCLGLGSNFLRGPTGEVEWGFTTTPNHFYQQRFAVWLPWQSYKHVTNAKNGAIHLGAKVLDRIVVTDLITLDDKVVGAIGFNKREGDFYVFKARAVVIATGTAQISSGEMMANTQVLTGDGTGMALRAGAELRGMEFGKCEVGFETKLFDKMVGMVGSADLCAAVRIESTKKINTTKIVNAKGEEFLEKYERTYQRPDRAYGGPPWDRFIPAYWKEYREGRGPCFMKGSGGPSIFEGEICMVGQALSMAGGIRIDPYGACSVPGLFAAGVASDMCCATPHSIPANILGSQATGRRAGESAGRYIKDQPDPVVDEDQVYQLKAKAYAPLTREKGIDEAELRIRMNKAHAYLDFRTEENLARAYDEFRGLEEEAGFLVANDIQEMTKCIKIVNMLQDLQATALAARERKEIRLQHYRHDYPFIDNKEWLKWVIITGTGDQMKATLEDIPFDKWKHKPEPERVDPLESRKEA